MTVRRLFTIAGFVASTLAAVGCDDASTATSPTTTSPVTDTFAGQLAVGGSAARSFTAASSGTASLTLTQVGPPAGVTVGFGIGIPQSDGSGCYLTESVVTGAATAPQIIATVEAGTYCLRLFDTGALTSQVAFSVTIVRP
jgi:hypothetical protein